MSALNRKAINLVSRRMEELHLKPKDIPEQALEAFLEWEFVLIVFSNKVKLPKGLVIVPGHHYQRWVLVSPNAPSGVLPGLVRQHIG